MPILPNHRCFDSCTISALCSSPNGRFFLRCTFWYFRLYCDRTDQRMVLESGVELRTPVALYVGMLPPRLSAPTSRSTFGHQHFYIFMFFLSKQTSFIIYFSQIVCLHQFLIKQNIYSRRVIHFGIRKNKRETFKVLSFPTAVMLYGWIW